MECILSVLLGVLGYLALRWLWSDVVADVVWNREHDPDPLVFQVEHSEGTTEVRVHVHRGVIVPEEAMQLLVELHDAVEGFLPTLVDAGEEYMRMEAASSRVREARHGPQH